MVLAFLGLEPLTWYLIISGVCSLILIITALLGGLGGGDFDVGDVDLDLDVDAPDVDLDYGEFSGPGISPLSLPIILIFGTSFGGFGALMEASNFLDTLVVPFVAALISMLLTGGMYVVLVRVFVRTQASTVISREGLVGKTAQVMIPIAPDSPGQILVITEARGRTLLDAVASEVIPRDSVVEIVGTAGNAVRVKKGGG